VRTVEFAADAERDFELNFDHLHKSYRDLGESAEVAFEQAAVRIQSIQSSGLAIAKAPYQGTRRPDILPGLRYVRRENAVFWFTLDDERKLVRILAVFFGGQDHIRHMLTRLLGAGSKDQ
jgi:plasmid stabilization system protein ParE